MAARTVKERRQAPRSAAKLLTAVRRVEKGKVTWSGFACTRNLSEVGALLESPDRFHMDQDLSLEFLLDDDKIVKTEGVIKRITRSKKTYHVAVSFPKLTAKARRLIVKQVKSLSK
ncbi:MAG TPA: PilZ domain-containing protein [Anaerolineae bacterium]